MINLTPQEIYCAMYNTHTHVHNPEGYYENEMVDRLLQTHTAKIAEQIERAELTDKELLKSMLGLEDNTTITEYAASQDMNQMPGIMFKDGAKAQLQAVLNLFEEETK